MNKKHIIAIVSSLFILMNINFAFAQQTITKPTTAAQEDAIITPIMPISYIVFAINALNTIQIQGNEVDAFLESKSYLENEINRCVEQKKKTTDNTSFSIPITKAQNLVNFLQRAKLTGGDAVLYKGFINALVEASKNVKTKKP